ncbi:MAG: tyrosine-type recombinase/integrase [Muribaculaceae bacterium]|nr:tyrosine-type recombinase/integrase [Muribaculaceae bacterium]
MKLIGEPSEEQTGESLKFLLPTHNMCLKALRHWTKRAGIEKHITWHCARHSFAVNILNSGANIKTVASLLGHSGLKHIEKYTRAVDSLKEAAINSLPDFKL